MTKRNWKVTPQVFDAVKVCLKGGNTIVETARFMKLSKSIVGFIANSDSYDEYKAKITAKSERAKERQNGANVVDVCKEDTQETAIAQDPHPVKVIHEQNITIQASHYMLEEQKKTNELLTLISNKLSFIVDELCPEKSGGAVVG